MVVLLVQNINICYFFLSFSLFQFFYSFFRSIFWLQTCPTNYYEWDFLSSQFNRTRPVYKIYRSNKNNRYDEISEKMYHSINVNTAMISLWIPNRNLCWVFTTGRTITKANLSENLIIFHWRMSTIQPAWPVCTTSICWPTRCWIFVTAAPTKRNHLSRSWLSPNTGSDLGVLWLFILLASLSSL